MKELKIHNLVRYYREKNAFSQKKLAQLSNVSQPTISGIETQKIQYPCSSTRTKLAKAFNVNVGNVFFPDKYSMLRSLKSL